MNMDPSRYKWILEMVEKRLFGTNELRIEELKNENVELLKKIVFNSEEIERLKNGLG